MSNKILTVICKNCGIEHRYEKKSRGRNKVHCSGACAAQFRDKNPINLEKKSVYIKEYYEKFPARQCLAATKSSALSRGLDFKLDEKWFSERLERGVCELTGLPIRSNKGSETGARDYYSPSIERINNAAGYIPSNVRMVAWCVNLAKNKFSERDLNALALSVVLAHVPKAGRSNLLEMLPQFLVASLPSGHPNALV